MVAVAARRTTASRYSPADTHHRRWRKIPSRFVLGTMLPVVPDTSRCRECCSIASRCLGAATVLGAPDTTHFLRRSPNYRLDRTTASRYPPADTHHRRQRDIASRHALGTSVLAALDTIHRLGCLSTDNDYRAAAIVLAALDTTHRLGP